MELSHTKSAAGTLKELHTQEEPMEESLFGRKEHASKLRKHIKATSVLSIPLVENYSQEERTIKFASGISQTFQLLEPLTLPTDLCQLTAWEKIFLSLLETETSLRWLEELNKRQLCSLTIKEKFGALLTVVYHTL